MEEIWKDVVDFGGYYEVSSLGRIRSVSRIVTVGNRSWVMPSKIRKASKNKYGYLIINFRVGGENTTCILHRVVAKAFIPNPNHLPEVNHKNGIKSDNNILNLEWVTSKDNVKHAWVNKLIKKPRHGPYNSKAKMSYEKITELKTLYDSGNYTLTELAKRINVSRTTLGDAFKGRTWKVTSE